MQLAHQLHGAGLRVFPCRNNKKPAVNKGESWKQYAEQPPQVHHWPSPLVGVPVPPGVVVLDLDVYKGVTRADVERTLGCTLPWDDALIQRTPGGGEHYAFSCDWPVRQGQDIRDLNGDKVPGLDTRVTGKGYICAGGSYQPVSGGVFRMLAPSALPRMPDAARAMLEQQKKKIDRIDLPQGDRDIDTIRAALSHMDPGVGRSQWLRIGMALAHQFHDDEATGLALFDEWSRGDLWHDGTPANYDGGDVEFQYSTLTPDGGITISSLFYDAIHLGWRPPNDFDTAAAFGTNAAPADAFGAIVDDILAHGADPKELERLIKQAQDLGGNAMQYTLLMGMIQRELKDAGLLTKDIAKQLEVPSLPKGVPLPGPAPELPDVSPWGTLENRQLAKPCSVHGANALGMLQEVFANRMCSMDGVLRWWNGREWERVDDESLTTFTFWALMPTEAKMPNAKGTVAAIKAMAPKIRPAPRDRRIYFLNGVLNLDDGSMAPHDRANGNIGTLSVEYSPGPMPQAWEGFLRSMFGDSQDEYERVALLQEIMGWCLIRDDLNVQKLVAFDGASRGGKGTILEVTQDILGDGSTTTAEFANMADGKTRSQFIHHDVAFDYEAKPPMPRDMHHAIGFMNKLASNERTSIQLLNTQTPWTGRLNCKYVIACNGIPGMFDNSGASANRFLILMFTRSFFGNKEDRQLGHKLRQELPQIAAWAVEGARRLIANGGKFTEPVSSQLAFEELKGQNQPLREFITEYVTVQPGARCHSADIWAAYRVYMADTNSKQCSRQTFMRSFKQTFLGHDGVDYKATLRIGDKVSSGYEGIAVRNPIGEALGNG